MRKYIKFIIVFLLALLVMLFIFKKYSNDFDVKPQVKYSEFDDYLLENTDFLVYVTNSKNVSEVKEYFESKNIEIIYMYLDSKDSKDFGDKYGINNLPKIVHFKDGALSEYIIFNKDTIDDYLNRNGFLE